MTAGAAGEEAAVPASGAEDETAAGGAEPGSTAPGPGTLRLRTRISRREMPRRRIARPGLAHAAADSGDGPNSAAPAHEPRPRSDRPRRRRPPAPRSGERTTSEALTTDGQPAQPEQGPRNRGPRHRRPPEQRARPGEAPRLPGSSEPPAPGRGDRDARRSGPAGPRDGPRRDGPRRDGQRRDGQRGRDAPSRRIEQKLYALEATVDRGFEDVADEAEESGTRRVHWVIVKRTVADQKSGKPMSATYVLQRDGAETDFPNLGAARAAANKTIVHPEKLTLSKAEHAAAKNK